MLTMAARLIDEKLSAAYGVPIIYLNNLERATYANARQMLAILVKDALRPLLTELQQCIQRDLLMPMGGVHAKFKAVLDPEVLLRDEARVYNEIVIARYAAGLSRRRRRVRRWDTTRRPGRMRSQKLS